jgi:hypothetical protein
MVNANGYSVRVESVRQNRIEAVRIRDHHDREREDSHPRPVEEAAATPRGFEQEPGEPDASN